MVVADMVAVDAVADMVVVVVEVTIATAAVLDDSLNSSSSSRDTLNSKHQ
jgi:hypothetical protein